MNDSHSLRYQEIKKQINRNKHYLLSEIIDFLQNNNSEKLKIIKASFSLRWVGQKHVLKNKLLLPHSNFDKNDKDKDKKIIVVKENLPKDVLENCEKISEIELLTTDKILQKIEEEKNIKIFAHPNSEEKIKSLKDSLTSQGIYPSKKNGCLTKNLIQEIRKIQMGEKELKTDKSGNIHLVIGNTEFNSKEQLIENYKAVYDEITKMRPSNWKGVFIKNSFLSTAMGPSLKVSQ